MTLVCPRCEREMRPGGSCCDCAWPGDIPATRYGDEVNGEKYAPECHDCRVSKGATHHYACTTEECPHREQAITCDRCEPLADDPYYRPARLQ